MTGFTVNYNNAIPNTAFNDLYLDSSGNLAIVETGQNEIIETCYHAIQLCMGDYNFNTTLGIPYNTYLSSITPIGNQLKVSITTAVLGVNGVTSIQSITATLNNTTRNLSIQVVINLTGNSQIMVSVPISTSFGNK